MYFSDWVMRFKPLWTAKERVANIRYESTMREGSVFRLSLAEQKNFHEKRGFELEIAEQHRRHFWQVALWHVA